MPKIFAFMLVVLLIVIPSSAQAQKKAKISGPKLSISQTLYDAGKVAPGESLSHEFTIKNVGDEDLLITKVVPACGCTVAEYDKVIAPGESGKVTLKVDLYPEWAGRRINQSAIVETNDPSAQFNTLGLSASVALK